MQFQAQGILIFKDLLLKSTAVTQISTVISTKMYLVINLHLDFRGPAILSFIICSLFA